MKNRGVTGRYIQTAFTQAEGELCLKGALPTQKRYRNACSIRITKHWERPSALVRTPEVLGSSLIWQPENHSIPIEPGPAQFNAFYPQCSGQKRGAHSSIARRSSADRILNIIGSIKIRFSTASNTPNAPAGAGIQEMIN